MKNYKTLVILLALSIMVSSVGCSDIKMASQPQLKTDNSKQDVKSTEPTKQVVQTPEQPKAQNNAPHYQIVYTLSKRYDGGKYFYVLINPIDLSSDSFKKVIMDITKDLVDKNGPKISMEFHDKKESLDISYKLYGDMSLGRLTTKEENDLQAVHYVAAFDGELKTGLYLNTLSLFPASTDNKTVEKYVGMVEFNPASYQN